ncbi:response regulator [Sphingosinicella rhizophila]|uniref:Response regulator n=1 Tax=Sphingosinicella rhizophila TaxID=3050082 RepID=A0ABU3Q418_9SPHN|nr:response regulator [Sphingosinicella sp. GR2756]MDT9598161.1 response regulator [Sphingosinicella sp. GR2756]
MPSRSLNVDESQTILLVDDDESLRTLIRDFLRSYGYRVFEADGGDAMRRILADEQIDVVVLDVMMPGEDGLSLTRSFGASRSFGIIMVSALGSETDRIVGLEIGADDYLAKPVSPRELLARIRAFVRRQNAASAREQPGANYGFANWRLDPVRRLLRDPQKVVISLSGGEFSLLQAFVERPQRVLTRDQLLEYARGPDSESFDRAIDTQISRLRRKLESRCDDELIRTVRNEGYMFMPKVTRA